MARFRNLQVYSKISHKKLNRPIETILANQFANIPDIEGFKKTFDKKFYKKSLEKIKSGIGDSPVSKCIEEYYKTLTHEIKELLLSDKNYRRGKLHVLRKLLKEYFYNIGIQDDKTLFPTGFKDRKIWIKKMMRLLGNWHDIRSLINEIQKNSKKTRAASQKRIAKTKLISKLKLIENQAINGINIVCSEGEVINALFPG